MPQLFPQIVRRENIFTRALIAFGVVLLTLFIFISPAFAQSATPQVNYQGKLTDATNLAVTDGTYNMAFRLYTTSVSATTTNIWEETRIGGDRVTVQNGLFSVMLGSVTAFPSNFNWNQPLYLGVEIGSSTVTAVWDGEMSPRKVLGTVPSAFSASRLDGLASTSFVRTDATSTIAFSSAQTLLTLNQTGAGNIFDAQAGGLSRFIVATSGNVGVGTSSPFARLSVNGDAYLGNLTATGTITATTVTLTGLLTSQTLLTTSATTTNLSVTTASTTQLNISRGFFQDGLADCSNESFALLYNASTGKFTCGADAGAGGVAGVDWNFWNGSGIRLTTTTNQVLIGGSATTTLANLEIIGTFFASGGATTSAFFTNSLITSGTASSSNLIVSNTATTGALAVIGSATSSFGGALSSGNITAGNVNASNVSATNLSASGNITGTNLSITNSTTTGTASTSILFVSGTSTTGGIATNLISLNGASFNNIGAGLNTTSGTLTCNSASAATFGCLSTSDWSSFNNKISSSSLSGASVIAYNSGTGVITTQPGTFAGAGTYTFGNDLIITGNATTSIFSVLTLASTSNLIVSNTATTTNLVVTNTITGNLTGNVTGNLSGNVTGNVTGTLTGSSSGPAVNAGQGTFGTISATSGTSSLQGLSATNILSTGNVAGIGATFSGTTSLVTLGITGTTTGAGASFTYLTLNGGNLSGNVIGNVTGNLSGNVTGNVTGSIVGPTGVFGSSTIGLLTATGSINTSGAIVAGSSITGTTLTALGGTSTLTNLSITDFASTTQLNISRGFFQDGLADCSNESFALLYNASTGKFTCGADAGAGGVAGVDWNFWNGSGIRLTTTTNQVLIGGSATTTLANLEIIGTFFASGGATTSAFFTNSLITSGTASSSNLIVSGTATSTYLVTFGTTTLALNGGRVGIGTSTPTSIFQVWNSAGGEGNVSIDYASNGHSPSMYLTSSVGSTAQLRLTDGSQEWSLQRTSAGQFVLYNSTLSSNVITIDDNTNTFSYSGVGNFSIGTSSPYAKLAVWGADTSANTLALQIVNSASTTLFSIANNGQASSTNLIVSGTATTSALAVTGGATSTFTNGIQLSGGCFRDASGTCVGGGSNDGAGATYVVAAYNSRNASYADYQTDFNNDEVEINAAIQAAYSSGRGGKVYLLEGDYRVGTSSTNSASIVMATSTALIGSGPSTRLILASSTQGDASIISASTTPSTLISNLTLDGNRANQSTGNHIGISIIKTSSSTIDHVIARSFRDTGVYAGGDFGGVASTYGAISNSRFENNLDEGIDMGFGSSDYWIITGNTLTNNGGHGMYLGGTNYSVANNTINNSGGDGIACLCSDSALTGNVIENSAQNGIGVSGGVGNTISGNTISDSDLAGIAVEGGSVNSVVGNTIRHPDSSSEPAISLTSNTSLNTVSGNTIAMPGRGIQVNSGNDNLITSNNISDTNSSTNDPHINIIGSLRNVVNDNMSQESGTALALRIDATSLGGLVAGNNFSASRTGDFATGTTKYTQWDRITLNTNTTQAYSLFGAVGSSSVALASTTQLGTGKLLSLNNSTGEMFTVANNGYVGIGTSSPYAKLAVAGQVVAQNFIATSSTASSTFAGGVSMFNNLLMFSPSTGPTANIYTTPGSYLRLGVEGNTDQLVLDYTGRVGIGINTIGAALEVGSGAAGVNIPQFRLNMSALSEWSFSATTSGNNNLIIRSDTGGNIGLGTNTPSEYLSVAGSGLFSGVIKSSSTTATSTFANGIELSGGCFRDASGSCVGGGASDGAGATYVVAAWDSRNASYADYQTNFSNDEVQINAAIQAAYSSGRGGKVYLLEGSYRVGTSSTNGTAIQMATGTALVGSGPGTVIVVASSTNGDIDVIAGSYSSGLIISDLTILGNAANQTTGTHNGISLSNLSSSTIERITANYIYGNGISLEGVSESVFVNNTLKWNSNGVSTLSSPLNRFTGNIFANNSNDGVSQYSSGATFTGNTFSSNGASGVYVAGNHNVFTGNTFSLGVYSLNVVSSHNTIVGNDFDEYTAFGVALDGGASGNIISSNHFTNTSNSGFESAIQIAAGGNQNIISSNVVGDTTGNSYAIYISDTALSNTLVGNVYSMVGGVAIADYATSSTRYTQWDRITLSTTNGIVGHSLLGAVGSSSIALASTTQLGTGKLLSLNGTSSELFTVANNGYVGIGTSSPNKKLDVQGNIRAFSPNGNAYILTDVDGSSANLDIVSGIGTHSRLALGRYDETIINYLFVDASGRDLQFRNSRGSASDAEVARFTNVNSAENGFFGLSSSTPWARLSVQGLAGQVGPLFAVGSSSNQSYFTIANNGQTTVLGTTTIGVAGSQAGLQIGFGGICVDDDGACVASTTGRISAVNYTTGNADLAEAYLSDEVLRQGEIVYAKGGVHVGRASSGTQAIIGVVSTEPGIILGLNEEKPSSVPKYPIGLAGRVPVLVSTEHGDIHIGDRIVLSSLPGVGMKSTSTRVGMVGIALENFDGTFELSSSTEDVMSTSTEEVSGIAEATTTPSGQVVKVGKILMFIRLEVDPLAGVVGDTSVVPGLAIDTWGENAEGTRVLLKKSLSLEGNGIFNVAEVRGVGDAWYIDTEGNIKARNIDAQRVNTQELCVGDVCLDNSQWSALLQNAGITTTPPPPAPVPPPTPVEPPPSEETPPTEGGEGDEGEVQPPTEEPPTETPPEPTPETSPQEEPPQPIPESTPTPILTP